ncbi:MAG: NAD(P)H-dependent oxidoreductase [Oscillospiraceae bacterium]|nr:NAD(P)H-dependent oxidoreductase [Oscillospiraceae bacterium]
MVKKSIGIIVGSLRRDSLSKKTALYLSGLLENSFGVTFINIGSLAIYNQDLDSDRDVPVEWRRFRQSISELDAVLFVTPEYNRSIPPVLKNALDIASRPMSENAWSGKPGAIVSVGAGRVGGFGVNHHLRQSATCLNIYMMQQPEAYIGGIADVMDANGVPDKSTQEFLCKFAADFTEWIYKVSV